jgi:hypothetical protein
MVAKQRAAAKAAGKAGKPLPSLAAVLPDHDVHSLAVVLVRAATAKTTGQAERTRERLAQAVADALGLGCKGPAMLTALRCGASQVVVAAGDGERDDAGGEYGQGGSDGAGGGNRRDRVPEHLRSREDDAEELVLREEESRGEWAALHAALESLRASDPEAAEVVRRRHGMDGVGEAETFEAIAAAPLRCTGRTLCRESARKMYRRAMDLTLRPAATTNSHHAVRPQAPDDTTDHVARGGPPEVVHAPMLARSPSATQSALRIFAARRAAIDGTQPEAERSPVIRRRPARACAALAPLLVGTDDDRHVERAHEAVTLDGEMHA